MPRIASSIPHEFNPRLLYQDTTDRLAATLRTQHEALKPKVMVGQVVENNLCISLDDLSPTFNGCIKKFEYALRIFLAVLYWTYNSFTPGSKDLLK
jgi:hypothetical protein